MKIADSLRRIVFVAAIYLLPSLASAEAIAYVAAGGLNVREGPGTNYAVIASLPRDAGVVVFGYSRSGRWCDVTDDYVRGWVYCRYLDFEAEVANGPISVWGPAVGLGFIAFSYDYYHDHYYRHYRPRKHYKHRRRHHVCDGRKRHRNCRRVRHRDRDRDRDHRRVRKTKRDRDDGTRHRVRKRDRDDSPRHRVRKRGGKSEKVVAGRGGRNEVDRVRKTRKRYRRSGSDVRVASNRYNRGSSYRVRSFTLRRRTGRTCRSRRGRCR